MRVVVIMMLCCALWSCSTSQKTVENDWVKENLSGKVKQVLIEQYKPLSDGEEVAGKENLGLMQQDTRIYNEQGYCVRMLHSSRGGKIQSKRVLEYDDKMQLIKEIHHKGEDNTVLLTNNYKYDENGDLIERSFIDIEKFGAKTLFEWNEDKTVKVGKVMDEKGTVYSVYEARYNEAGDVLDDARFNRDGASMTFRVFNQYDKDGNLIRVETYHPVGNNFTISIRNSQGQEIEVKKYREGIIASACTYSYDEKGNESDVSCDIYENQVKRVVSSTMKYEYDAQGNWTKKVTYQDDEVTYVIERTYEYYP